MTAIRHVAPLAECGEHLFRYGERHLRTRRALGNIYPRALIDAAVALARRCRFDLKRDIHYRYPAELVPAGHTPTTWLRELTERGAQDHAAGETTSSSRATTIDPRAAEEELAKLRALGYLGSGESERANPEILAAGGDEATRTASAWNNAGLLLRGERRDAEARVAFERALRLEPGLAAAQWNLSELLEVAGQTTRADELLLGALAGGLPDGVAQVVVRARAAAASGDLQRSLALLDRALAARPDAADLWLFRGRYRIELGSCAAARGDLEEASRLAPANSDVLATAALAALCAGDRAGAEAALRRALALAPRDERLRRLLAEIASGD